MRRNSTSSQDATPVKAKEDSVIKKLPTIVETTDDNAKAGTVSSNAAQNETQQSEKALVDELAAAFVEDFIDDDEWKNLKIKLC